MLWDSYSSEWENLSSLKVPLLTPVLSSPHTSIHKLYHSVFFLFYFFIYHVAITSRWTWWLIDQIKHNNVTRNSASLRPFCFLLFHPSCLFPLSGLLPALLLPGCRTHVISPPVVPLALERHKRLRWRYQQQPLWLTSTSPFLSTACRITVSTSFAPLTLNYPQKVFFLFPLPKTH